jgi:hypothetical protein
VSTIKAVVQSRAGDPTEVPDVADVEAPPPPGPGQVTIDEHARAVFHRFAGKLGFAPVAVGGLRDGGKLMQLGGSLSAVHAPRHG